MAYSPVAPPPTGALGQHSFMPVSSAVRDELVPGKPDAGAVFFALRDAIASRPGAFAEEHMNYLARLAELAETAHARERTAAQVSVAIETPETHSRLKAVSNVLLQSGRKVAAHLGEGKRRYWTVAATLVLLLVSVAAWKTWHKPTTEASAAGTPIQSHDSALTPASAVGAELVWKPSPERPLSSNRSAAKSPEQPSAKAEVSDVPSDTESSPVSSTQIQDLTAADTIKRAVITDSDSVATEAPQLSASNLDNRKIGTLLSGPVTLPKFGTPISQGVSEGVLEHQVAPIYPRQAFPLRLEGHVVLDATVSENGQLENVKVVSGHALLAQAAIEAVKQMRYCPYLLNGKPVRMQTKITVNFKMPRS